MHRSPPLVAVQCGEKYLTCCRSEMMIPLASREPRLVAVPTLAPRFVRSICNVIIFVAEDLVACPFTMSSPTLEFYYDVCRLV